MKKLLLIAAVCGLVLSLAGCHNGEPRQGKRFDNFDEILTAEYNGHSYIIYKGYRKGGITHDPDCPCREKGGEE